MSEEDELATSQMMEEFNRMSTVRNRAKTIKMRLEKQSKAILEEKAALEVALLEEKKLREEAQKELDKLREELENGQK